jgi:hypothetical protein
MHKSSSETAPVIGRRRLNPDDHQVRENRFSSLVEAALVPTGR